MYTIYNNICQLCEQRGIKPGKMCADIGLSRSILTDLKTGRKKSINTDTARKIADYFSVSVDTLLGTQQINKPAPQMGSELDIKELVNSMSREQLLDFIVEARIRLLDME